MRPGEVFGLKWEDIDFTNMSISIKRQHIIDQGIVERTKTKSSQADIAVCDALINILKRWKLVSPPNTDFVIPSLRFKNKAYKSGYLRNEINAWLRKELGITLHYFRTAAHTLLDDAGIRLEEISPYLRHSSVKTTEKHNIAREKNWTKKIARAVNDHLHNLKYGEDWENDI